MAIKVSKINKEVFFAVKYQIYAFLYYMSILSRDCFYLDPFIAELLEQKDAFPTLNKDALVNEKDTICNWLSDIKDLIHKKKILKLILNCNVPERKRPVKQLVIEFSDIKANPSLHDFEKCKQEYLKMVIEKYAKYTDDKPFYDTKGAKINMIFVYKKRFSVVSKKVLSKNKKFKNSKFSIQYDYLQYCISSKINLNDGHEVKQPMKSSIKKTKKVISQTNKKDYIYSDIEESQEKENNISDETKNISNSSNICLNFD